MKFAQINITQDSTVLYRESAIDIIIIITTDVITVEFCLLF